MTRPLRSSLRWPLRPADLHEVVGDQVKVVWLDRETEHLHSPIVAQWTPEDVLMASELSIWIRPVRASDYGWVRQALLGTALRELAGWLDTVRTADAAWLSVPRERAWLTSGGRLRSVDSLDF